MRARLGTVSDPGARPWETEYTVEESTILSEANGLRVLRVSLAPGDVIPWHRHTAIDDTFLVMTGTLQIDLRAPEAQAFVRPGETFVVPAGRAHRVSNDGPERCRVVIVQGVGPYDFVRCPDQAY